jgi:DNA-binding NtrC family response regulator
MRHKVLIVDDEPATREVLKEAFSAEPYDVLTAVSADEALALLARQPVSVVISDEKMPGLTGSEFLSIVRKKYPDTIRMILTGHAELHSAIRAINEGEIYRFFTKPCNIIDLAITVRQALQHRAALEESRRLQEVVDRQSAILDDIEKEHPGISILKRATDGAIIIDE